VYYQNLWEQMLHAAVPLLEEAGRVVEGAQLCRKAVELDPCNESYYQLLMRCLLHMGQREEAAAVYEEMRKRLFAVFGVVPDKKNRELYREALQAQGSASALHKEKQGHSL
jgi:pentatricopeptide repeat protein